MTEPALTLFAPSAGPAVLYFDGGSRGNPGPAAWGFTLTDADGTVLAARGQSVGTATNNVAEYGGVIAGMECAKELGVASLIVRGDSKLVIEQLAGNWKVKAPGLQELFRKARALAGALPEVRFEHVRRGGNAEADRLVNAALDSQAGEVDDVAKSGHARQ
jgi:probable phosphoglycerate mutase